MQPSNKISLEEWKRITGGGAPKEKKSKYNNAKTIVDGITFDSKSEGEHWIYLKARLAKGEIRNLRRQIHYELIPKFDLLGKHYRSIEYVADFVYEELQNGAWVEVVSDKKGKRTKEYIIKNKLMAYLKHIQIREV